MTIAFPFGMSTQTKWMKVVAILAITAIDACGQERRAKGDLIVISIPDRKLVLFSGGRVLKIYDVAVGKRSTPSPEGEFKIISHVKNPTWYGPHLIVPPGKNNPLGTRWMGLSVKGYGIHGTNVPSSVGKPASHGCFRMRQADLEELFDLVDVGVTVELRGQTPQFLAEVFGTNSAD